jgi:hypothetical protein
MLGNPILHPSTSLTSSPTKPTLTETTDLPLWSILLGLPLYWLIQTVLRVTLDLRDLPGSASTLSILYATGKSRGSDAAAYVFNWCRFWLDVDLETAMWLTSTLSGTAMIVGIIATATSIWGKRAGVWAGILGACWPLSQQMGLLVGLDSLAIGSTWLGLGCLAIGLHGGWWGLVLLPIAGWMLPLAVDVKSIAIPSLVVLSGILLPPNKANSYKAWLVGLVATLAFATTLSGTDDHRVVLPEISRFTIEHGWHRLQDLPRRGLPEGMFQTLLWIGGVLSIGTFLHQTWLDKLYKNPMVWTRVWGPVLLWGATGIGLCITAAGLGELSRPRYLVGLGMGLLLPIAASLANYSMRWAKAAGILLGLHMLLNTWGFFGQWGQVRQRMLGGNPPTIPTAPSIWAKRYVRYPILTLRDLTMMGALDFQDSWTTMPQTEGIAVPRLRDDRHRNLQAYAAMTGQSILILDPGKCCAGTPVNAQCANRIVKAVQEAHLTVVLPTEVEGVERVHANEKRWVADLRSAIASTGKQSQYWHWQPADTSSDKGTLPCQFEVPQNMRR